jgi:hypothetical protein
MKTILDFGLRIVDRGGVERSALTVYAQEFKPQATIHKPHGAALG